MRCNDCIVQPDSPGERNSITFIFALQKTVKLKLYEPQCTSNKKYDLQSPQNEIVRIINTQIRIIDKQIIKKNNA